MHLVTMTSTIIYFMGKEANSSTSHYLTQTCVVQRNQTKILLALPPRFRMFYIRCLLFFTSYEDQSKTLHCTSPYKNLKVSQTILYVLPLPSIHSKKSFIHSFILMWFPVFCYDTCWVYNGAQDMTAVKPSFLGECEIRENINSLSCQLQSLKSRKVKIY